MLVLDVAMLGDAEGVAKPEGAIGQPVANRPGLITIVARLIALVIGPIAAVVLGMIAGRIGQHCCECSRPADREQCNKPNPHYTLHDKAPVCRARASAAASIQ